MAQQRARNYGMSLSNEVNMTNCYKHCKHFFDRHNSIHFNVLIAYWMMAGYLGPIDSIEEAYKRGHDILLDLTFEEGSMLKPSNQNPEMIEFKAAPDSESLPCSRHKGLCFMDNLGFGDLVDLKALDDFVVLADGMIRSVRKVTDQISDGATTIKQPDESVLLIEGNHLSRQVFHPPKKLTFLAFFKPTPKSLNLLLNKVKNNVKKPLSVLLLRDCDLLREIDIPLAKFDKLTVLEISGLSHVPTFKPPEEDPLIHSISELSQLQSLHLSDFLTEKLPDNFFTKLTKLHWVIFRGCPNLVSLPSIKTLKDLKMLDVSHCSALPKIASSVLQNPELRMLDFSYTSIKNIPVLGCPKLTRLIARDVKVSVLGCLKQVSSLEVLDLSGAKSVKDNKQLASNKNLRVLDLSRTGIKSIDFLPELIHLRDLILQECAMLTKLPAVRNLTELEVLDMSGCVSLKELPEGLNELKSLKKLNLSLTGVTQLPSFANLTSLVKLSLRALKVVSLEGLESLSNMEELDLNSLKIESQQELKFDFLQNLVKLQILDLSHTLVAQLPDMSTLVNLKELLLENCQCLMVVPDLQPLTNLEILDLSLHDSSTVNNGEGETEIKVPSSCRKLVLKNRSGVKGLFPLTSHGELRYLDLRGTDADRITYENMSQMNCVWLPAKIGLSGVGLSRMGSLPEAIDWRDEKPGHLQGEFSDASEIQIVSTVGNKSSISAEGGQFFRLTEGANWEAIIHRFSVFIGRDEIIYLDGDEFVRDELCWGRRLLNLELEGKSVEIHGFSEVPKNVLQNTEADNVAFVDNDFLKILSDICLKPIKVCCIRRCKNMVSVLGGKDTHAKFPEKLVLSDLSELKLIFDEDVPSKRVESLKHLHIDCCPNLENVFTASQVDSGSLETLHVKFCDELKRLSEQKIYLSKLQKLILFELRKLESIEADFPALETLNISQCPKLKNLDGVIESASESLTKLSLECLPGLVHALPSSPELKQLKEVKISSCSEIVTLFGSSSSSSKKQNLQTLRLRDLPKLKSIGAELTLATAPDLDPSLPESVRQQLSVSYP